jgi:uncharacterized membrane protein YhaH (DUF805 family)
MARKTHPVIEGLFSFDGRFRRSEYWIASIGLGVVRFVLLIAIGAAIGMGMAEASTYMPLSLGLTVLFLWPSAAIAIKRGHDRNRPAWWTLTLIAAGLGLGQTSAAFNAAGDVMTAGVLGLLIIPVGLYMFIDYGLIDGTKGPNRYGASPKGHGGQGDDVAKTFD